MKRSPFFALIVLTWFMSVQTSNCRAQEQTANSRKVVSKVAPIYPPLARTMSLTGAVKLEVLVQPNGDVKTIQVRGGNPLLVQSAQTAIHGWKWEKTDRESTELVEFRFNP